MNKTLTRAIFFIVMVVFLSLSSKIYAGSNDTLVVYASGPSLDNVINRDTTAGGMQAHSVYKLVSLDTTYIFLGAATVKSDITVIGVIGSDGRLPCIQPGVLADGSVPVTLFNLTGKGTTGKFENLYIFELSTNGTFTGGATFVVSADSVKLYLNNIIDEENHYIIIMYTGSWDSFFITNCKIRNAVGGGNWYVSQLFSPNLYLPNNPVDTLVMNYNTFFCTNDGFGAYAPYANYYEFNHNSAVYSFIRPPILGVGSAKINNNIFYGVLAGGNSESEATWIDDPFQSQGTSVINFDTLTVAQDSLFDPMDAGKENWRMLAEAKRRVEVKNNIYFMPREITDFWTTWNDTHDDSLYTPGWMNDRTTQMFSNKADWPGFEESGNLVAVDPGYGASLANVLNGGEGYGIGLLEYINKVRGGTITTEEWGYQKQTVTGNYWIPNWPLPEQTSGALKYSAALTAPDGKPYGDPYWFTLLPTGIEEQPMSVSIPVEYSLEQNYPNPFNPSTVISYRLPKAGYVSLKIYDVLGNEIATLVDKYQQVGDYSIQFSTNNYQLSSGIYFYRLTAGNFSVTKKMMLIK